MIKSKQRGERPKAEGKHPTGWDLGRAEKE